jgi:aminoglycoside phosphotransferase (APT) family kinase protein
MSFQRLEEDVVRKAMDVVDWPGRPTAIRSVEDGVNDVFVVSTAGDGPNRVVCKFATFSEPSSFGAGVQAVRVLGAHTYLPVPAVYTFRPGPPDLPAFQIQEFLPGEPLSGPPNPEKIAPARALGTVIRELGSLPPSVTEGYGMIESPESELASEKRTTESRDDETTAVGEYEDWTQWLLEYTGFHYDDPPDHEALASVAPDVPDYLRENAYRLPAQPDQSIVLTDFGPSNILTPGGTAPDDGRLDALTGVLDLERAKLGPMAFCAVNAEYLMTRFLENPAPVVEALYDPLPFGPDVPNRDLYRLVAMGRSVNALDLWYEEGSETFRQRGTEVADQIAQIV